MTSGFWSSLKRAWNHHSVLTIEKLNKFSNSFQIHKRNEVIEQTTAPQTGDGYADTENYNV